MGCVAYSRSPPPGWQGSVNPCLRHLLTLEDAEKVQDRKPALERQVLLLLCPFIHIRFLFHYFLFFLGKWVYFAVIRKLKGQLLSFPYVASANSIILYNAQIGC